MAVYKRGKFYWFDFVRDGERYQRTTRQTDERAAIDIEAAFRTRLAKGDFSLLKRERAPSLTEFAQRFIDFVATRSAEKPRTIQFYGQQLGRLLDFEPLATARVDAIDESLIEKFVQWRTQQSSLAGDGRKKTTPAKPRKAVCVATVNRSLATLRKLLRLAHEWHIINRIPRVRLLPGERYREFILPHAQEKAYLEMARQPLKDVATLILDTGLRMGEAMALEWPEIHLDPASGAKFGYLRVREGKSRFARRNVPLTETARAMLENRKRGSASRWVFAKDSNRPMLVSSLDHQHKKLRKALGAPKDFVLHSLRHTYGTRLGEAGADAFTIMRLMGHSSVTVSQRYVHPTPEALERAVEKLEGLNQRAAYELREGAAGQPKHLPAGVLA